MVLGASCLMPAPIKSAYESARLKLERCDDVLLCSGGIPRSVFQSPGTERGLALCWFGVGFRLKLLNRDEFADVAAVDMEPAVEGRSGEWLLLV